MHSDNVLRIPRRQSIDAMHGDRLAEQAGDHPRPFWPADDIGADRAKRALDAAAATIPGSHRRAAVEKHRADAMRSPVISPDRRLGRNEGFEDGVRSRDSDAQVSFWIGFAAGGFAGALSVLALQGVAAWI